MLSKLMYLIALVLFIVAVLVTTATWHPLGWAFVFLAAGLLLEGYGPVSTVFIRRTEP